MAEDVPVLHPAAPAPIAQAVLIALPEEAAVCAAVVLMEKNHPQAKRNLKHHQIHITPKKTSLTTLLEFVLMKSTSILTTGILQGLRLLISMQSLF